MNDNTIDELRRALGTLTADEFNRPDIDPWQRVSRDAGTPGRRDAFIGNGLIGIRIPVEGQPSPYPTFAGVKMAPGGTQMYNVWDSDTLLPVLNFMALELRHGRSVFRRDSGVLSHYTQTLDWRTGTVRTVCDWVHWGGVIRVEIVIWLARHSPNLGCVEMSITPDCNTNYTVIDRIDGAFIPDLPKVDFRLRRPTDAVKTLFARCGARQRLLAASSVLMLDGVAVAGDVVTGTHQLERRHTITVEAGKTYKFVKFGALCADTTTDDPINTAATLVAGAMNDPEQVRREHEAAWARLWEHDVEVGHPGAQMLIHNALYQLYSNARPHTANPPGPCGLTGNAWGGHIFHDAELWTYPVLLLLHPELARNYVDYRFNTLPGARRNAAAHAMAGAQFAWESAESGDETIPGLIYSHQHHINSDVALSQWQYFMVTGDWDFLRSQGAEIITSSADFWVSRSVYNDQLDRFEIRRVCCVDEFAGIQDNNAFTNYSAKLNLELAVKVNTMLNLPVNPAWREVAAKLWIPFDAARQLVVEYENYDGGKIKQADATLVIYPGEMALSETACRNTVDYYRVRYPQDKIIMGSTIDGIIDCKLGRPDAGWKMFLDLLDHIRGDFMMVSESPINETISMLTGLGGLLQLVIMGWGGVRIREQELVAQYHLPPEVRYMKLKGLCHRGRYRDLLYENGTVKEVAR